VQLLEDKLSGQIERRMAMRGGNEGSRQMAGPRWEFPGAGASVVTGGARFLGSRGRGQTARARLHGRHRPAATTCDLSRWDQSEQLFDKCRPHLLLHLAATVDNPPIIATSPKLLQQRDDDTQLIEASSRMASRK